MPGLLRIRGEIDLEQFWPSGESDADTTKIKVKVDSSSFKFAADGKDFKPTSAYFGAFCVGASRKAVIDKENRITVRLQGIDAPELHYRAAALRRSSGATDKQREKFNAANRQQRRQYLAESATVALSEKLQKLPHPIDCVVHSLIDKPFEVIDTYGRFVGNICVGAPDFRDDINLWLAKEGWVYPTFYSSMENEEIQSYLDTLSTARSKGRVWQSYSRDTSKFEEKLIYRPHGPVQPAKDKGKVLMPKIFRRQVSYRMQKKAGLSAGTFASYLEANKDSCFALKDFMKKGQHAAEVRALHQFMDGTKFAADPYEVVFREKFSDLVDRNNRKIVKF